MLRRVTRRLLCTAAISSNSSNPNSNNKRLVHATVWKAVPEHEAKPLRDVARSLPEPTLEAICEEHGGLRQFMESLPDVFRVSAVGSALCVRRLGGDMATALEMTARTSKQQQQGKDQVPMAAHTTEASSTTTQQPTTAVAARDGGEACRDESKAQEEEPTTKRKIVPLFVGRPPSNKGKNKSKASPVCLRPTGMGRPRACDVILGVPEYLVPLSAVAQYRKQGDYHKLLEEFQQMKMLDLVFLSPEKLPEEAYVRVLPPYAGMQDGEAAEALSEHKVQSYDHYRLARLLDCSEYTAITPEYENKAQELLHKPLMHVVLSDPQKFDYHPIQHAVRYICPPDAFTLERNPLLYSDSDEELVAKLKELRGKERFMKKRVVIIREQIRRKYPRGNPFLDPNVLGYLIFDSMPDDPTVQLSMKDIRELIPDKGRTTARLSLRFFTRLPELFNVIETEIGSHFLVTKNIGGEAGGVPAPMPPKHLSDEEIVLLIKVHASSFKFEMVSAGVLFGRLPLSVRNTIKMRKGTVLNWVRQFPKEFELNLERQDPKVKLLFLKLPTP